MSDLTVLDPQTEFDVPKERKSDVDGFTIVRRTDRSPRVHLLRPYNQCNTERSKSGRDTIRVEGGKEQLVVKLAEMGHRSGVACRICFPYDLDEDRFEPVDEMVDPQISEVLDAYDDELAPVEGEVVAEL